MNAAINEKKLLEIKRAVDSAKSSVSELKGQEDYLIKELQTKYGCKSLAQAEEKLLVMLNSQREKQEMLQEACQVLEEAYENAT